MTPRRNFILFGWLARVLSFVIAGLSVAALTACNDGNNPPPAVLTEIYQPDPAHSSSFIDVTLHINSMKCSSWSACNVRATGLFQGNQVGIEIDVSNEKIVYRSVGEASDRLLLALATLYKLPPPTGKFSPAASADIIFLTASDQKMAGKVFFAANGPQEAYAELYTNIDKKKGMVEIKEKDSSYRKNVIGGFSN